MSNTYTKQPLSIADQIAKLKLNGLIITNPTFAEKVLKEVSYFRFAAYLRPMEANKQIHQFKPNSTFENAVNLYEFDNKLRQLLFAAIQHIEVALRAKIIQYFFVKDRKFHLMISRNLDGHKRRNMQISIMLITAIIRLIAAMIRVSASTIKDQQKRAQTRGSQFPSSHAPFTTICMG